VYNDDDAAFDSVMGVDDVDDDGDGNSGSADGR